MHAQSKVPPHPKPASFSISHALLDRALQVYAKDPAEWTHADDLFMLSLYGGANKSKVAAAFTGAQAQDRLYKRVMQQSKIAHPGNEAVSEVHPQIVAMRPILAAYIDWEMLLSPLKMKRTELGGGWRGMKVGVATTAEYHPPDPPARG